MSQWPKPYLLQVYSRAIAEGCVRIPLPNEAMFRSFSQSFYRLRRRSDKQHASFILPEYHLVFCSWEPERGTALIVYDALPDGVQLPPIEAVEVDDRPRMTPERREVNLLPQLDPADEAFDPEKFVADLVSEAGSKLDVDNSDNL